MGSSLTLSLFLLSVVFWQFVAAAVAPVTVKAKVGADVTLPCKTDGTKVVVQVEWVRSGQSTAPVLLFKEKKVDANQLAAYKDRVSLVNPEKGDLSLLLKKVVDKDAGKYECRVELGADGGAAKDGAAKDGAAKDGAAKDGAAKDGGGAVAVSSTALPATTVARKRSVLKSEPISIVELTVEGAAQTAKPGQPTPASHGGAGRRPSEVLPTVLLGLLGLLGLIAGLQ